VQPGPQRIVGVEQEGFELVGGLGAGLDRAAPGEQQQPQLADEPAPVLGIALASPAAASLEQSRTTAFGQHPDAEIITSFPGLGTVLGARILAEIGDDRARFATARGLKAFAGTAPVTRASGRKIIVTRRVVRNKRLGQAAYLWALPMIAHSPKAHAHFTARREHGDSYSAAARNLANHGIGMLYHCLRTHQLYNETRAFPSQRATSGKPPATQALQETEARAHPAPADHDEQTVTSFAPPASQAYRKTEAQPA
jgi:hypothetical protein